MMPLQAYILLAAIIEIWVAIAWLYSPIFN